MPAITFTDPRFTDADCLVTLPEGAKPVNIKDGSAEGITLVAGENVVNNAGRSVMYHLERGRQFGRWELQVVRECVVDGL